MNGRVYILKVDGQSVFKIGFTGGKVDDRIKDLQTGNPHKIRHIFSGIVENEAGVERYLHGHFKPHKMQGEWYKLNSNQLAEAIRIIQGFQLESALKLAIDIKPIAQETKRTVKESTENPADVRLREQGLIKILEDNSRPNCFCALPDLVAVILGAKGDIEVEKKIKMIMQLVIKLERRDLWEFFEMDQYID